MIAVAVTELRAHLAEVVARAGRGETVTVTSGGVPQALLTPLPSAQHRPAGFSRAQLDQLFTGGQMDTTAWSDINSFGGGTIGQDRLDD